MLFSLLLPIIVGAVLGLMLLTVVCGTAFVAEALYVIVHHAYLALQDGARRGRQMRLEQPDNWIRWPGRPNHPKHQTQTSPL